jgi:hypothetical protein
MNIAGTCRVAGARLAGHGLRVVVGSRTDASIAEQTPSGAKTAVKIAPRNEAARFVVFKLLNLGSLRSPYPEGGRIHARPRHAQSHLRPESKRRAISIRSVLLPYVV